MLHWKFTIATAIALAFFMPSNVFAAEDRNDLAQQLIDEARKQGLKIDESKIVTESRDEVGDFAGVPLTTDSTLNVTSEQIKNGEVYATFQCMKTKQLSGCYRTRITDVLEGGKGLSVSLVSETGEAIASTEITSREDRRVKRSTIIIVTIILIYRDHIEIYRFGFIFP